MEEFFKTVKFEFRITLGENWDHYIAKSEPEALLDDLTKGVHFKRNTEVNQFKNIIMHTNSLKEFNLRINVGLNMLSEVSKHQLNALLPKLKQIDDFDFVFTPIHRFQNPKEYFEPLIDLDEQLEPLPKSWYKLAYRALLLNQSTTYDDPTFKKQAKSQKSRRPRLAAGKNTTLEPINIDIDTGHG